MSQAPGTRDRILDAFTGILVDQGERSATLDEVAAVAGVSKGGLLYHFGSKEALVKGLIARLEQQAADDLQTMATAPEGAIEYFVRTSVDTGSVFDRSIIAVSVLAKARHQQAEDAMLRLRDDWYAAVCDAVDDPDVALAITLLSDGLYANTDLVVGGESVRSRIGGIIAVVQRLL